LSSLVDPFAYTHQARFALRKFKRGLPRRARLRGKAYAGELFARTVSCRPAAGSREPPRANECHQPNPDANSTTGSLPPGNRCTRSSPESRSNTAATTPLT
jgi:hypothetical protein